MKDTSAQKFNAQTKFHYAASYFPVYETQLFSLKY